MYPFFVISGYFLGTDPDFLGDPANLNPGSETLQLTVQGTFKVFIPKLPQKMGLNLTPTLTQ